MDEGAKGARDRALLLIGFTGDFRRSEIVALDCVDVERVRQGGVIIRLRGSKTDQEGAGRRTGDAQYPALDLRESALRRSQGRATDHAAVGTVDDKAKSFQEFRGKIVLRHIARVDHLFVVVIFVNVFGD